jgi:hypothetical protein
MPAEEGPQRLSAEVWETMSAAERKAHVQRVRSAAKKKKKTPRGGRGVPADPAEAKQPSDDGEGAASRLPAEVWASMTPEERRDHAKRRKREKRNRRPSSKAAAAAPPRDDADSGPPSKPDRPQDKKKNEPRRRGSRRSKKAGAQGKQQQPNPRKAWRFAQYDRVWCNLGGDTGWTAGNVQVLDEPTDEGGSLPYVVMLDPPIKQLISVPSDANLCLLPDVCFEE